MAIRKGIAFAAWVAAMGPWACVSPAKPPPYDAGSGDLGTSAVDAFAPLDLPEVSPSMDVLAEGATDATTTSDRGFLPPTQDASDASVGTDASDVPATFPSDARADVQLFDDGGPCGGEGQRCCGILCGPGLGCSDGRCVSTAIPCGGADQPCCVGPSGASSCDRGQRCTASTCRPCGMPGMTCCDHDSPSPCTLDHYCAAGACAPTPESCGHVGQACCANNACTAGARCNTGVCIMAPTCGDRGLPCCATDPPCQGGLCQAGFCVRPPIGCGRSDLPCCEGDQCSFLYHCVAAACVLRNVTCGGLGQPCCPDSIEGCGARTRCFGGICHPTPTCGLGGLRCCTEVEAVQACSPMFRCAAGMCIP